MRHGNFGRCTHFEVHYQGQGGLIPLMNDKGPNSGSVRQFMKRENAEKVIEARGLRKGVVVPIRQRHPVSSFTGHPFVRLDKALAS